MTDTLWTTHPHDHRRTGQVQQDIDKESIMGSHVDTEGGFSWVRDPLRSLEWARSTVSVQRVCILHEYQTQGDRRRT